MLARLAKHVPILRWLPRYRADDLGGDVTAGLTTAVMLIPQAMAYAMLAGLPPIVGLYASIVPLAVYAAFGTSRELAVGPVAMVSLMVAAGVGQLAEPGSARFVELAVLTALMVGVLQFAMGAGRLGFLVNFLSHPVISGFTSAAALIIGASQLGHLLGLDIARSHHVHAIVLEAASQLGDVHGSTVAIGLVSLALLLGLRRLAPRLPRALIVVVLGTLIVWGFDLHDQGVAIVGAVPSELPLPALPTLDLEAIRQLLPTAVAIALVAFMESISVAKAFARRQRYEVEPNQELVGLGLANVAGSFFGAYPVTGGFSRTAVNAQAGSRTPLASIITAAVIALTVLFLTPLFFFLPKAVLAAIIMAAVFGLVDLAEVKHLWRVERSDLALLVLTFAATLGAGIEAGILAGVVASLLWFVVRTTRPHTAVLGRLPGTNIYRNLARFPEAEATPGILAIRVDAQFYYGNVTFLKDKLKALLAGPREAPIRAIVVEAGAINQLDSSADTALHEIADELSEAGIALFFAGVKGPVRDVMKRSGFWEHLGEERFLLDMPRAMAQAERHVEERATPEVDAGSGARGRDGRAASR